MREHEIPQEKHQAVQSETIYTYDRRVKHLRRSPYRERHKNEHRHAHPGAGIPQAVLIDFSHKHEQHREQPEHLDEPEHASSTHEHDQGFCDGWDAVHPAETSADSNIDEALQKPEYEQPDSTRDKKPGRPSADEVTVATFKETVSAARIRVLYAIVWSAFAAT